VITYVNSSEAKLFDLARQDLLDKGIDVGADWGLDEYLNRLVQLKEISPKYVRLPLYEDGHRDEEIFEINANERTIKVPSTFSKNGVGVVSDELAETIWFRINRYFDIKDFGKAAGAVGNVLDDGDLHILIQWEAPDKAKGASWAYAIDKDTDPDFIYFGWALTAEHLTKQAGNIRFGIRILQYDSDGIAYSFATQAAQVAVKPGLGFDLTDVGVEFEDVSDKIANRLMGGQIAHCPIFEENLPTYINLELPQDAEEGDLAQASLDVVAVAPNDEEYDAMAYKWYRKGPRDEGFVEIENQFTPALTVTESGSYYVVVFGMKEIVDAYENIYVEAEGEEGEEDYVAGHVVEGAKFKYHTSIASAKSAVCVIPAPIKLNILNAEELPKFVILQGVPQIAMLISRQTLENNVVVGEVTLNIEKTVGAPVVNLDLNAAEWAAVDTSAAGGVSYTVDNEGHVVIDFSGVSVEEGYYRATIVNTLNGSVEMNPDPNNAKDKFIVYRVVKPATIIPFNDDPEFEGDCTKAVLLTRSENESTKPEGSIRDGNKIQAHCAIDGLSDSIEINWYEVAGEQDPDDPRELEDEQIPDQHGEIFTPDHQGTYYFIAINHVENTQAEARSNTITFTL
jgi:hypothetical protein